MKFKFIILLVVLLAVSAHPAGAQQNPKPLSKDQIMGLARAGMETSDLVKLIHEHGIDFDPSSDYMQALRQAGAQEPVLQALRASRPKRLSREQVLELLTSHVPNQRTADLVKEHGIDFSPDDQSLEMLRLAGADETVIAAVRAAGGTSTAQSPVSPPAPAENPSRPNLKITVQNLDDTTTKTYKLPDGSGALVVDVTPGGAGDIAGLEPGDVVRKVNGQAVNNADQLPAQLTTLGPGIAVLEVWRDGEAINLQVSLGMSRFGYFGVSIHDLDEARAKKAKAPDTVGAFVEGVAPGGPADLAGLKAGDVVCKFNGQATENASRLTNLVTNSSPGTVVQVDILRDGRPLALTATVGERPAGLRTRPDERSVQQGSLRGVTVRSLTAEAREDMKLAAEVMGVVVIQVIPNTPAGQAGLEPGDVIESINRQAVKNLADFENSVAQAKGTTLLLIYRQGKSQFITVSDEGGH